MACSQPYTPGSNRSTLPQQPPGQQQASVPSESGGSLIFLGFIGLLGLMYFAGKK